MSNTLIIIIFIIIIIILIALFLFRLLYGLKKVKEEERLANMTQEEKQAEELNFAEFGASTNSYGYEDEVVIKKEEVKVVENKDFIDNLTEEKEYVQQDVANMDMLKEEDK